MGRRRTGSLLDDEQLSQKNQLLEKITDDTQDNEVEPGDTEEINQDNLLNKEEKSTRNDRVINVGDTIKLKSTVQHDILGRRIHNGIRNYNYKVLNIRDDGYITIECLTYVFVISPEDIV